MDLQDPTLWVAVGFVILVAGVYRPGKKALLGMLDARIETIRGNLDEASELRRLAEQELAEYQRKQREAKKNAEDHVAQARGEAERQVREEQQKFEAVMERREQAAMEKVVQAEAEALREVRAISVETAMAATRRLIAGRMDPERRDELVDSAVRGLRGRLH